MNLEWYEFIKEEMQHSSPVDTTKKARFRDPNCSELLLPPGGCARSLFVALQESWTAPCCRPCGPGQQFFHRQTCVSLSWHINISIMIHIVDICWSLLIYISIVSAYSWLSDTICLIHPALFSCFVPIYAFAGNGWGGLHPGLGSGTVWGAAWDVAGCGTFGAFQSHGLYQP